MKVYAIPGKPQCPLRIQMSDDGTVSTLQFRGEDDVPFYWLLISPTTALGMIAELGMKVAYHLPDTPLAQMSD